MSSYVTGHPPVGVPVTNTVPARNVLRHLQDHPRLLERIYLTTAALLERRQRWFLPGTRAERSLAWVERLGKGAVFDCRMCGHCVLHSTGMTCPMTCPKNLRNGPCGGVRPSGYCEVLPDRRCIWVQAWERSRRMPVCGDDIRHVLPPLNHSLQGTSAWVNELHLQDRLNPKAWR